MAKLYWRKAKTLAMLANRRQWGRDFYPPWTTGQEIEMEHLGGYYLVTEASTGTASAPSYIITE